MHTLSFATSFQVYILTHIHPSFKEFFYKRIGHFKYLYDFKPLHPMLTLVSHFEHITSPV